VGVLVGSSVNGTVGSLVGSKLGLGVVVVSTAVVCVVSLKQICQPARVTLKSVVQVNVSPLFREAGTAPEDSVSTPRMIK